MSQIFHPSANTISKASIYGAIFVVGVALFTMAALDGSSIVTRKNVVISQPVPFSHEHHVAEIGIDCRYCHTTVEEAAFAGIPSTAICMNCHSMIFADSPILEPVRASFRDDVPMEWVRVHDVPDFVYFDHSIHVAKGIGCTSCHGDIGNMPLTRKAETLKMVWCLDCHRDPVEHVRPRDKVFDVAFDPASQSRAERERLAELYDVQSKMSCSACHR